MDRIRTNQIIANVAPFTGPLGPRRHKLGRPVPVSADVNTMDAFDDDLFRIRIFSNSTLRYDNQVGQMDPNAYSDLRIQEGSIAASAYARMIATDTPRSEKVRTKEALLAYFQRDTEAMVQIFEALLAESSGNGG